VFHQRHVNAAHAAWDELSGRVYQVYATRTPYVATIPGDLNRIVYGPSAEQIAQQRDAK
jgi:hypothetical protein